MSGNGEKSLSETLTTVLTGSADSVILSNTIEVGIRICNGKTLPKLLKFGARISDDLGLKLNDAAGIQEMLLSKVNDVSFILNLIANYTDDVYALIGDMTTLGSASAVGELQIDDLMAVFSKVVEVNQDFFMKRVLPMLRARLATQGL